MTLGICFIGGARYTQPLDTTTAKKFRLLKKLGRIYVIAFSKNSKRCRFDEDAHFYLFPDLPVPILRYALMFIVGPWIALWCILQQDAQLLVAQSPFHGFVAAWAKKLARILGKQVILIVESHGDFEEALFMQRKVLFPNFSRFLMRHVARFTFNHADLLRPISEVTSKQLERWAPGKHQVRFATWTDIDVFLRANEVQNDSYSETILYTGVLTPLKGVHLLVNAFALITSDFPQAKLTLVGRAENRVYATELQEQVKRLGLEKTVQFFDELPQAELALLMHQASVFVLPSLSEGLGRVVFEAMATGTPVIGSRVGGIPEIIQEGVTGFLVSPGDEQALAERLRWLLVHPDKAREMGHRARAFAKAFFSTDRYIRGYAEVFEAAEQILT